MFKDGLSTNGLSVGVKNDRFDVVYDVVSPRVSSNAIIIHLTVY